VHGEYGECKQSVLSTAKSLPSVSHERLTSRSSLGSWADVVSGEYLTGVDIERACWPQPVRNCLISCSSVHSASCSHPTTIPLSQLLSLHNHPTQSAALTLQPLHSVNCYHSKTTPLSQLLSLHNHCAQPAALVRQPLHSDSCSLHESTEHGEYTTRAAQQQQTLRNLTKTSHCILFVELRLPE
jgi:hypothetical protein